MAGINNKIWTISKYIHSPYENIIFWWWSSSEEKIICRWQCDKYWFLDLSTSGYCPYDWYVSIDGWEPTRYTWSWSSGYVNIWRYSWDSVHLVEITPVTDDYWWAKAFKSYMQNLVELIVDSPYKWYADSATNTWDNFKSSQFNGAKITVAPIEYLPDTVTTIWKNFRYQQYYNCKNLTSYVETPLPSSVTSIWEGFRDMQMMKCTGLTDYTEAWFNNLSLYKGRSYQFGDCTNLKNVQLIWNNKGSSWRFSQFSNAWNADSPMTIKIISDIIDAPSSDFKLTDSNVEKIYVPLNLLGWYKVSPWWNRISSEKFIWY